MTKRALLSVFDKTGITEFARALAEELGFELVSSGGTATAIAKADIPVTTVESLTGLRAIMDHRVATLDYHIHGGILADVSKPTHVAEMEEYGIPQIDLVVVGLYPFSQTVASGASFEECIEKIDIGGPTLIRGAAKNHARVGVITNPSQYDLVLDELREHGGLSAETRRKLAVEAFAHTASYDQAVVEWISNGDYKGWLGQKVADCDYGENRWQSPAALYTRLDNKDELAVNQRFQVRAGRSPSYVNWTDVDRLLQTVTHLMAGHRANFGGSPFVAVAAKHGNPCGAAVVGGSPEEALQLMLLGNPQAVFGAVVMTNFSITEKLAETLIYYGMGGPDDKPQRRLLDGICAPEFEPPTLDMLGRKDGKYFLAENPALGTLSAVSLDSDELLRPVRGGALVQPNYGQVLVLEEADFHGELTDQQQRDLVTAWAICATSNSNTVTLVHNNQLIGNGVGQQDRVGCCELAVNMALLHGHQLEGAVAASDSFFPFPDGPAVLVDAGVKAIFSTTGSRNDEATQKLCEERGVGLVQVADAVGRGFYRH